MSVWLKKDFNMTPKLGSQTGGLGAMNYDQMVAEARAQGRAAAKDLYQRIADDVMDHIKALRLD